jgi:hypothetical protein
MNCLIKALFTHETIEARSDAKRDKTQTGGLDHRERESREFQEFGKIQSNPKKNRASAPSRSARRNQDPGEVKES